MFAQVVKARIAIILFVGFVALPSLLRAEEGDDLAISNPFYQPYAGDFFVESDFAYKSQGYKLTTSPITASQEIARKDTYTTLTAKYGIVDSLAVGVYGSYMFRQEYSESRTGFLSSTPDVRSTNSGFFDLGFAISGRLLGTRREEWFLNIDLAYQPGIRDSNNFLFSYPHNQYGGGLTFGKNTGNWNFGAAVTARYFQSSVYDTSNEKNDQVQSVSLLFLQYDFDFLYVKLAGGGAKFLDSQSNSDALKKKFFPSGAVEIGFLTSDNVVVSSKMQFVSGASADSSVSGINFNIAANPLLSGSLSVAAFF